jgi:signal transduction histidine kinase
MKFNIVRNAKISIKLTIIYAFMFSLILLILNASVLYGIRNYCYSEAYKQVNDVKNIILDNVNGKTEKIDIADKKLLLTIPNKENLFIKIVKQDGEILNTSYRYNYRIKFQNNYNNILQLEEGDRHLLFENVKIQSNNYGTVTLQIVKDMDKEYDFLGMLFFLMTVADLIGVISSIIIGYIISKKLLKPIAKITKTAENISINNLRERIDIEGPDDELKRLANTFNNMINRLQDSFDRQTQFVSDASHELRTPIAVISGYANLLDRWGKDDRSALEKSIYAIKLESANMSKMIEELLLLAKGDSGKNKIEKTDFLLSELVNEIVMESKLIDKEHNIFSEKNDNVSFFADRKMIKQALRVFIDNSIKFTPKGGNIVINSEVHENTVEITISDTGIGIPKNEIDNIFDRFYTVDKSRSREKGGTGLGLPIAKWIIEMNKGIIDVFSEEGKGTMTSIKFNLEI